MNPSRPSVHWASSDSVEGQGKDEDPDILTLLHENKAYDLYFKPFAISDGFVHVFDVKKSASRMLNIDPELISLSYKDRVLYRDHESASEYGLKHLSEVVCVIVDQTATDAMLAFRSMRNPPRSISSVPSPGWPGMSRTASHRNPAGFDPNTPGGDEQMAPRTSAYAGHAQPRYAQYYPDRLPSSKTPVRGSSTETRDSGNRESIPIIVASSQFRIVEDEGAFPTTASQGSIADRFRKTRLSAGLGGDSETGHKSEPNRASSRYAMVGHEKTLVGESSRILGVGNPKPDRLSQKQPQTQHDGLSEETINEHDKVIKELQATNDQSDFLSVSDAARPKAGDQPLAPEQPARSRSAPVTDFHSNATKAFEEDVFVWSSVTREFTATLASVDTQSDRNLVYLGFVENDLQLEFKKYGGDKARPLRTLAGNAWPLGWVMLKIFPLKVNPKSGVLERHRPQYVVFDVYETTTFGDMLLGNEYAEGYDICNFLIKGSRKTTAQSEALRRQREEEFRRFEAENAPQTPNGQTNTTSNASTNNSGNSTGQQR